jgi:hypothetical protein
MSATSRELVYQTLEMRNPARAPRDLWVLPIATNAYPNDYKQILAEFPLDFQTISGHEQIEATVKGDPHLIGEYVDVWGCTFLNIQRGVIGEVRDPLIKDWQKDVEKVHIPAEWLSIDVDAINRDCAATDKFTFGSCCPRPFEQLQFIRGTANLYMDLMDHEPMMTKFMRKMQNFYSDLLSSWAKTDVDGLNFMDDWGSQGALLISPELWREYFKPMYADYAQIAHGAGKKIFMHSDGHILSIYPDLVELGIDAINSQIFCMGAENLRPFAGKTTFWGEIDRQHLLSHGTPEDIDRAVRQVHGSLWFNGGCIAQCEFGAGASPENVRQVFVSWNDVTEHYWHCGA